MDPTTTEAFRVCLLQMLREADGMEMPVSRLVMGAKLAGFPAADAKLANGELRYLQDKSLTFSPEKLVSPENREWRITATGRDYLASRGL